jgi:hypothetical protein
VEIATPPLSAISSSVSPVTSPRATRAYDGVRSNSERINSIGGPGCAVTGVSTSKA